MASETSVDNDVVPDEVENSSPKRSRHVWRWILTLVGGVIVLSVLVLGYFGLVPGLSSVMGANTPKDLGIRWDDADYQSYLAKTEANFKDFVGAPDNPAKPGKKIVFADPKQVSTTFTSEELTAAINSVGWSWMPLTNAQVKSGDGNVEVSGNVNIDQIENFIRFIGGVGYSEKDVNKAVTYARKLFSDPAIYIKASATGTNDSAVINVESIQVGRFTPPIDIASKVLQTGTNNAITRADNFTLDSAVFTPEGIQFNGTLPTTIYVKRSDQ